MPDTPSAPFHYDETALAASDVDSMLTALQPLAMVWCGTDHPFRVMFPRLMVPVPGRQHLLGVPTCQLLLKYLSLAAAPAGPGLKLTHMWQCGIVVDMHEALLRLAINPCGLDVMPLIGTAHNRMELMMLWCSSL
jgi:hypothetical protein